MSASICYSRSCSGIFAAVLLAALSPCLAAAEHWLQRPWRENVNVPAGRYEGPESQVVVMNKLTATWLPGSLVEKLDLKFEGEARFAAKGCHFRETKVGLGLWARLDVTDSLFESPLFRKVDRWFDTKNSSCKWRFENCVFTKSFMGDSFRVADSSVRAVNCTFIGLKAPSIDYRDNDVVNQARQDWLKFEKCRFVDCEINDRFLLCTQDCVSKTAATPVLTRNSRRW